MDLGFWILDFGLWILDFGFRILDFGFWILDFGSWILDFGFWIVVVSVLFVAAPNAAVWILDFGFWILDFGFWILDFGFWILDFGFRILDFGFWERFGFCIRLLLLHADSGRRICCIFALSLDIKDFQLEDAGRNPNMTSWNERLGLRVESLNRAKRHSSFLCALNNQHASNGCILAENNFTSNLQMVSSAGIFFSKGPKGFGAISKQKTRGFFHVLPWFGPTGTAGSGGVSYPSPRADLSTIASQAWRGNVTVISEGKR